MTAPPEKRRASAGDRGAPKIDRPERQIDETNNSPSNQFYQGQSPLALLPCPVAVAKQFGFCHAVFVRHQGGRVERRGLFESAKNAACAAKELNRLFSQERGTGA